MGNGQWEMINHVVMNDADRNGNDSSTVYHGPTGSKHLLTFWPPVTANAAEPGIVSQKKKVGI